MLCSQFAYPLVDLLARRKVEFEFEPEIAVRDGLPPFRAQRRSREHGIWGRQEARSSRSERALDGGGNKARLLSGRRSKAYRGFESLSLRSCPLAVRRSEA